MSGLFMQFLPMIFAMIVRFIVQLLMGGTTTTA